MTRIFSEEFDEVPRIDRGSVVEFFEQRAVKSKTLGALRAVIYQDKNPDLAERRDTTEKSLLLPKLELEKENRILDLGCGTGRWASVLVKDCARYHGVDVSPGLIKIAQDAFVEYPYASFSVCAVDQVSLSALDETAAFDRILCIGVLMYLNDDEVVSALNSIAKASASHARLLLREPIGVGLRLTIKEHFSEDMDQIYNAIYRTETELLKMIDVTLGKSGFKVVERGDVYADTSLNNRVDTKQRWFVIAR
jgi:cyclopropane fatty-acyl-phospholipid synthase-like methyltransferase